MGVCNSGSKAGSGSGNVSVGNSAPALDKKLIRRANVTGTAQQKVDKGFVSEQAKRLEKMPQSGDKIKTEFINYVKYATGIDLNKARDTMFDKRNVFNIDVRNLSKSGGNVTAGETILNQIRQLSSSNFDFNIQPNGATRYAITVTNKQYKKK